MASSYVFRNGQELLDRCGEHKMPIWKVVLNYEIQMSGSSKEEVYKKLGDRLKIIFKGIDAAVKNPEISPSGMVGKSTPILSKALKNWEKIEKDMLLNEIALMGMLGAIATGENNARMGVILAFPTAGAAGVLPGVIYAARKKLKLTDERMIEMMLTASGVGIIIANTATLSGAAGGCQAEVGSATAMAAAALTEIRGKSPETSLHASSLALKNMLGLACDPIGGLVEVPCIKRNALGAVFSMAAADMACMGIESFVPFDEVVSAMRSIGDMMNPKIRETALGGLAVTPTGQKVAKKMGLIQLGNNPCSK